MPSIDQRVVEMKFNNGAFQSGIAATLSSLDKLKEKLGFSGAAKGLEGISKAASGVDVGPLGRGLDAVQAKFSALQVAGIAAFATIVSKATAAGSALIKSFTVAPVMQGFDEYELKIKSTQTILANTARHGTTLATVNKELNALNEYSDKTIYNFAEMTKNASLFTASGMKIEDATTVIKGFSNAAAASGTGATEAAGAAYQLSQALNKGKITMEDWRSLANAGMGNKNMQESLIETAKALGTFSGTGVDAALATKDFTGTLEKGWLTAEVMSTYLKGMSGDMTDAELAAKGFSAAQIKALQTQAKMGLDAATQVRTLSALMGTLKESVTSGWAQSFETIFGDFTEATALFTGVNNAIGGMISRSSEARNKMLADWKADGGREAVIEGVKNVFNALLAVLRPVGEAFRNVFPATTGKQLADMSRKFQEFTEKLIMGEGKARDLKNTFEGVFSVFKLASMLVKGVVGALFELFGAATAGSGGVLAITGLIGQFITGIVRLLTYTDAIGKFFAALVSPLALIKPLIGLISALVSGIAALFTGDVSGFTAKYEAALAAFEGTFDGIKTKIDNFTNAISQAFGNLGNLLSGLANRASAAGNTLGAGIAGGLARVARFLSDFASDAAGTMNRLMGTLTAATSTGKGFLSSFSEGALGGISVIIERLSANFDKLKNSLSQFGSGASGAAKGGAAELSTAGQALANAWESVTSALSGFGKGAGGVLSSIGGFFSDIASKISGFIDKLNMTDAIAILNAGFLILLYTTLRKFVNNLGDMVGSINGTFDQLTSTLKSMQSAVRANIIMQIAIAVGVLIGALFILAKIDAAALKQALVALAVVFGQVAAMLYILTKIEPASMVGAGVGMIALAAAIVILATAIKKLGEMDPDVLVQGGIALAAMMAGLAVMVKVMNKLVGIPAAAAGLLILSAALLALSVSLKIYAGIPWKTIEQGLVKMALTLIALGVAMQTMPRGMVAKATGLVILAGALIVLSGALRIIAGLKGAGKAMIIIAGGLLAMAAAMQIANGAFVGALGLAIVAASIMVMVLALKAFIGVLEHLAKIPMKTIEKSIKNLIKVVQGIAKATLVLALVLPFLVALAAVAVVAGAGLVMLGAGMTLFAGGLALLGTVGVAGVMTFLAALPAMVLQVGLAFKAVLVVIRETAGKIAQVAVAIVVKFAQEIAKGAPKIYAAALDMIIGFMKALNSRIYTITALAVSIVTNFLNALTANLPKIITSGVNFVLSFVEGLAKAIRGEKQRTGKAGTDLAMALVEGMVSGLKSLAAKLITTGITLFQDLVRAVKGFLGIASPSKVFTAMGGDIIRGVINGIANAAGGLITKARGAITGAISAARNAIGNAASIGGTIISNIISGIANKVGQLREQGSRAVTGALIAARLALKNIASIGGAIVDGIIRGLQNGARRLASKAAELARSALTAAKKALGIASPSKEFEKVGEYVNEGFVKGLLGSKESATQAYAQMTELLKNAMDAADARIVKATETQKKLTESRNNDSKAIDIQSDKVALAKTRLNELTNAKKKDNRAIAAASVAVKAAEDKLRKLTEARDSDTVALKNSTAELIAAEKERADASAAYVVVTTQLQKEREALDALSTAYEDLTGQVKTAEESLQAAIRTRDDYNKSIVEKYGNLPDINRDTTLVQYVDDLEKKIAETTQFSDAIQKLKDLGLSDDMYKELLAKGVDAFPFVQELLAGGKTAVENLNKLGTSLDSIAKVIGVTASNSLYEAGVTAAQGLVDGLKSKMADIQAQMAAIAAAMQAKITAEITPPPVVPPPVKNPGTGEKRANSPAERAERGKKKTTKPVVESKPPAGANKGAKRATGVKPKRTMVGASSAASAYDRNIAAIDAATKASNAFVKPITYNQYNNSPKALTPAEIYRQTNNQLSTTKRGRTNA